MAKTSIEIHKFKDKFPENEKDIILFSSEGQMHRSVYRTIDKEILVSYELGSVKEIQHCIDLDCYWSYAPKFSIEKNKRYKFSEMRPNISTTVIVFDEAGKELGYGIYSESPVPRVYRDQHFGKPFDEIPSHYHTNNIVNIEIKLNDYSWEHYDSI